MSQVNAMVFSFIVEHGVQFECRQKPDQEGRAARPVSEIMT
jgi:hypothetical protein